MGSTYCNLLYHAVFSTKNRQRWISSEFETRLFAFMGGTVREKCEGVLLAANGTEDHVHLLLGLHQTKSIANVVRDVKSNSSRWIHQTFPDYADFEWQGGYGAFTVSVSQREKVKRYIARQKTHHGDVSFETEFIILLDAHEIEYDKRYVFD